MRLEKTRGVFLFSTWKDVLCEATYLDYYPQERKHSVEDWRKHIDHCVDIPRQKLICYAIPILITYNWLRSDYNPYTNSMYSTSLEAIRLLLGAVERCGIPHDSVPTAVLLTTI